MPNCGYCRDCKWWTEYDPTITTAVNGGYCRAITDEGRSPRFAKAIIGHGKPKQRIVLSTAHDFGCVQWEAKNQVDTGGV